MSSVIYMNSEKIKNAIYCTECGLCNIVCPLMLSPQKVITYLKEQFLPYTSEIEERKLNKKTFSLNSMSYARISEQMGLCNYNRSLDFDIIPSYFHLDEVSIPFDNSFQSEVTTNQKVKKGDIIARSRHSISKLFASITGTISNIDNNFISIKVA